MKDTNPKAGKRHTAIYIDIETHRRIKSALAAEGITLSDFFSGKIREYLNAKKD